MSNTIMIIAGEASGDLHGSGLVRELKSKKEDTRILGIGGDKMLKLGMEQFYHVNDMSVLGFIDVLKQFRFFKKVYNELVEVMDSEHPDALVLIDYPGLNLKLADAAHKRNIPVFYYIAPQVWAWGAGRLKKMKRIIDKVAAIIPFEEKMYREAGIDATFVGHPLLDVIQTKLNRAEFYQNFQLSPDKKTLGLLPGSRTHEVNRLLPEMVKTFNSLKEKHPDIQAVIGKAGTVALDVYKNILGENNNVTLIEDSTYEIMKHSDQLIVASGTATLESALFETPLVIVYRVDHFSYLLGKQLVKINYIGLVNVIAEREIVPEFIQHDLRAEKIAPVVEKLLFDAKSREEMINNLQSIKAKLGESGAAKRAADMVYQLCDK